MYTKYNNPRILDNFLNYMLNVRGCSINTIKAYNSDLIDFFTFIKEYLQIQVNIREITIFILFQIKEADIYAYMTYLNFNKNNNPYTRQRKITALKSFYKWIIQRYSIASSVENPVKNISSIKKVQRIPKHLNLEQAKKIQTIFNLSNSKFPLRNNTIISLFLSTGMRISELININLGDIDFKNSSIRVIGKFNKERLVYMNTYCKKQVLKYLKQRNIDLNNINKQEPLFINYHKKQRIGIDGVENIVENAYKLMGLDNMGYTAHTLRHTAATLIYQYVKQDIFLLKEMLGHKVIQSSQIYTYVYDERVQESVNKNPLNNF